MNAADTLRREAERAGLDQNPVLALRLLDYANRLEAEALDILKQKAAAILAGTATAGGSNPSDRVTRGHDTPSR